MNLYKMEFLEFENTVLAETAVKAKYKHWIDTFDDRISFKEYLKYVKWKKIGIMKSYINIHILQLKRLFKC